MPVRSGACFHARAFPCGNRVLGMLQHPLLPLTCCYAAGVVVAAQAPVPLPPAFVTAFGVALLALGWSRARGWLLLVLLFLAGLVNLTARTAILSPHDLRLAAGREPVLTTLRGRLVGTPTLRVRGEGDWTSVRSLAEIEAEAMGEPGAWQPVAGRVAVSTPAALAAGFFGGQRVEVFGVLHVPRPPRAPGLFDARSHFRWLGIHYQLDARDTNDWRLSPGALPRSRRPVADRFIEWAQRALARGLPAEDEPLRLMWAMTLGWRTALTGEVAAPFMQSGTMHVFAISGLHVVLLAGVLVTVLRVCRVPRRVAGWLVAPCLWAYAGATGWQPSAVRSTVMMTVVVGGWALERPGSLLNSLAGAGMVLLVWEPRQLFQAGFQLSFFVVLSMALLLPPLQRLSDGLLRPDPLLPAALRPPWRRRVDGVLRRVLRDLAVSLSAWLGSLPLIAHYFHLVTPVSLLANLIVVPLSALVLTCNVASLFCAAWLPWVGELFNHAGWFWMLLMVRVSEGCARLPGAFWWVADPGLSAQLLYYGLLVAVGSGWFRRPRLRWIAGAVLSPLLCATLYPWLAGRGDSTLVVLPVNGGHAVWADAPGQTEDLLVDCGNLTGAAQVVVPFLHARGLDRLPNLALTHGDVRHVGGAPCLESNLPPTRVWTSAVRFRSPAYRDYLGRLGQNPERHRPVSAGDRLAGWEVLHPGAVDAFSLADDHALVLGRRLRGIRVLLLSDLGSVGEAALLARGSDLRADILVSGLPGRGRPLSVELLEVVQPRLIIVADDEPSGPARATLELRRRLLTAGVPTVFTSDEGALTVRISAAGWSLAGLAGRP